MLQSVTVTNHLGDSITLELKNPEETGFYVVGITGLGPPKADISMSDIAAYDGSVFNSSRVSSRNIVISLIFNENNVEYYRHLSYKYFPIKRNITLDFVTSTRTLSISGYVESNEVGIFSKRQGCQVSIVCPDPWFYDTAGEGNEQTFSNVERAFEFEYLPAPINDTWIKPVEELYPDSYNIEFSRIVQNYSGTIDYEGDLEVGMTLKFRAFGTTGDVIIYNTDNGDRIKIVSSVVQRITGYPIQAGDEIIITTHQGNKTARLLRGGRYRNILSAIDKTSNWFKVSRGQNTFLFTTVSSGGEMSISIRTLYEGI